MARIAIFSFFFDSYNLSMLFTFKKIDFFKEQFKFTENLRLYHVHIVHTQYPLLFNIGF